MPITNYLPSSRLIQPGVCTSTTRPASPFEGQHIYETDTDKTFFWNGSSWIHYVSSASPTFTGLLSASNITASGTVRGSGSIVQVVSNSQGSTDLQSQGTPGTVTMTPKFSDSSIWVMINYHAYKYNSSEAVNNYYRLKNNTTGAIIRENGYVVYSSPSYMFQGLISGVQAAGSTTSRQYSLLVDASPSERIYFYWSTMYAIEVAS